MTGPQRVDALDQYAVRMLTEVLHAATRDWWLKRAQDFLDARPRPEDFHGGGTVEERREQWRRLTEIANACRARAQVAPLEEVAPEAWAVWCGANGGAA